ncbi:hypothetical protein BAUCODRAFT_120980 [Baudoinia panamericana UAMH 10762]|uniref:Iron-sulfur cluster assembly factor IBA57 homolog, mitochondrial n=1 Tax=Baudoinia panamericana (strain UAMH 10762) TaxID=717646 RepID=M2NGE4_BAUPA|nr:uncharacterized protein BAUCODRAFT_120980 [Baudoinia panamericana UAMH 10762]EMC98055.1 hypothetical protein BAUCODRAFT_120980 [Baudoinia panamericana UAMH 10762]
MDFSTFTRRAPYICAQCRSQQLHLRHPRAYSSTVSIAPPPPPPPSAAVHLTTRRLISIHGPDSARFLQGLITANLPIPQSDASANQSALSAFYAAFLTAQGRVLHDVFIYPTMGTHWHAEMNNESSDPGFLVEVDAAETEGLMRHLKRHKLRAKLKMAVLEQGEGEVWQVWREGERWTRHGGVARTGSEQGAGAAADERRRRWEDGWPRLTDCRGPSMGQRLLYLPAAQASREGRPTDLEELEQAPLSGYTIRRYLRGVPEGQKEIARDDSLPMNCNIDLMGGIDFKKGCYVGQELTIRTHHTGVVRRRILPVVLYPHGEDVPGKLEYNLQAAEAVEGAMGPMGEEVEMEIRRDDARKRSTGKLIARVGSVGLGMCRLEQMSDLTVSGEGSSYGPDDHFVIAAPDGEAMVGVKAFVPDWLRGRIREPKIQRRVDT